MTSPTADLSKLLVMGQTPQEVQERLRQELQRFGQHLQTRQDDWTSVQPGREWSPAQEAEHVIRTNETIGRAISLLLSDRELRPQPQMPGQYKDGKRQAPDFLRPSAEGLPWAEHEARWQASTEQLLAAAAALRATPERKLWHPFLGELDALDWSRMVAGHLQSHRVLLEQSARK